MDAKRLKSLISAGVFSTALLAGTSYAKGRTDPKGMETGEATKSSDSKAKEMKEHACGGEHGCGGDHGCGGKEGCAGKEGCEGKSACAGKKDKKQGS
jgi:hypothetical protein